MGILELWVEAENSSDLQHHEKDCHVDVLGAIGMGAKDGGHLAVYRLKYLDDADSYQEALQQFYRWTRSAIVRRRAKLRAGSVGKKILAGWLDDVCGGCGGRRYEIQLGQSPRSIECQCKTCNGSGKKKIYGPKREVEVILDVMERADAAVETLRMRVKQKLVGTSDQ